VRRIDKEPGRLIDRLRAENPGVMIQGAGASAVYGRDHALGVLDIASEALERKVMIANRPEAEALLRLACTDQISEAMKRARLKEGEAGCFIAFSKDAGALKKFGEQLGREFALDDSVIERNIQKKKVMAKAMDVSAEIDDEEFLRFLLERAAILVKG
jgi:tRNA threonylcarbamoyladenosine modification (KEOPS) complex Cgi121 subunit